MNEHDCPRCGEECDCQEDAGEDAFFCWPSCCAHYCLADQEAAREEEEKLKRVCEQELLAKFDLF